MKKIHAILFIILVLSSCYTDEPPSVRNDLIGTWQLESVVGHTYQEEPNYDDFTYEKVVIHSDTLKSFKEEFTFHESGVYQVKYDSSLVLNDMAIFAFTAGNVNIDPNRKVVFGIWEEFLNGNVEHIIHFDQRVNRFDPFMIVEEVTSDKLTLVMDLNNFNEQDGKELLKNMAIYQGAKVGFWMAFTAEDNADNGHKFGKKLGIYEGFNDNYPYIDNNFLRAFGSNYEEFFKLMWADKTRTTDTMDQAFTIGRNEGAALGMQIANQHDNQLNKGFQLVYQFKRN